MLTTFGVMSADDSSLLLGANLAVDCLRGMSASSIARWGRMARKAIQDFACY